MVNLAARKCPDTASRGHLELQTYVLSSVSSFQILRSDSNLKNSDAEIQQRALEYLKLSTVASPDVLVSSVFFSLE